MYEVVYTPYPEPKEAIQDLKEKIKRIKLDFNLAIVFLVGNLIDYHKDFSKIVDCNCVCIPVEGFAADETIWGRGALLILADTKYKIQTFSGPTDKVCKELRKSNKFKFNLLVYPTFYFGGRLSLLNALIKEKRFYRSYKNGDKDALQRASEFLEEKLIYPINKILRSFRDRGEKAISINLFPLEIKFGTPIIGLNGKAVKRSVIRIGFKKDFKIKYDDTFPERGDSVEDTIEILKNEFHSAIKIVNVDKKGVAIGHIDGKKVVEFVAHERNIAETKRDIVDEVNKGKFLGATPYGIWFLSKETFGSASLGIFDYPLGIYPSLYDLDNFNDLAVFTYMETGSGLKKVFECLLNSDFEVAILDQNYLLMYESRLANLVDIFKEKKIAIFTLSSLTAKFNQRYTTEVERNLYLNLTRNLTLLKIK